jgi:hypothetical protein
LSIHQFFTPASFSIEFVGLDSKNIANHDKIYARLVKNERITALDHHQDVRHMEFNINSSDFE